MYKKLNRAVVKEEFVNITGHSTRALILNQFIYWSERVSDFDQYIEEENERREKSGLTAQDLTHGWIYKSVKQLHEELMLSVTPRTIGRHLDILVKEGFLHQRTNPIHKWDRTKQYRVDFHKVAEELAKHGLTLNGYKPHDSAFDMASDDVKLFKQVQDLFLCKGGFN